MHRSRYGLKLLAQCLIASFSAGLTKQARADQDTNLNNLRRDLDCPAASARDCRRDLKRCWKHRRRTASRQSARRPRGSCLRTHARHIGVLPQSVITRHEWQSPHLANRDPCAPATRERLLRAMASLERGAFSPQNGPEVRRSFARTDQHVNRSYCHQLQELVPALLSAAEAIVDAKYAAEYAGRDLLQRRDGGRQPQAPGKRCRYEPLAVLLASLWRGRPLPGNGCARPGAR